MNCFQRAAQGAWVVIALVMLVVSFSFLGINAALETMQPAHISLWVRQPRMAETPSSQIGKSPPEQAVEQEEIAGHGV